MDLSVPAGASSELAAAFLQAGITLALALLCALLHRRYAKPYLGWFALAWGLYTFRLAAIISFILTADRGWLYWHQVITGWVALALLWAAIAFSQQRVWRWSYALVATFPLVWSYVAIYRLQSFLLAAGPMVVFLSLATLWTGWVFARYRHRVGSVGAALLSGALLLWGLHHLDYPFLRARGAWNPWGYYLDILFELALGAGILLLVVDDLTRGLNALSAVSADLQRIGPAGDDVVDALLQRPLALPAVRGAALYLTGENGGELRGAGVCAGWTGRQPGGPAARLLSRVIQTGHPEMTGAWDDEGSLGGGRHAYVGVLPVLSSAAPIGTLILVGDAKDPFTALNERFLLALGQQMGNALESAELYRRVQTRTADLERLARQMVRQHENERRRISRELHDETAQVLSAVRMELGVLKEQSASSLAQGFDRALDLMDTGIRGIREVTNALRPSLLDDLGLLPALHALATEFSERSGTPVAWVAPDILPGLSDDAEVALFRALQEGLANVARHAGAGSVAVSVGVGAGVVALTIADDGRGFASGHKEPDGDRHMGLAGMRERIVALRGTVQVNTRPGAGVTLEIRVPAEREVMR
jgi:signal transduction histidine kinase